MPLAGGISCILPSSGPVYVTRPVRWDCKGYRCGHWLAVKSGIQFAAVKATEGAYYQNPFALTDLAKARAAGLSVVAYTFALPNGNGGSSSPVAQADYLIRQYSSADTVRGIDAPGSTDLDQLNPNVIPLLNPGAQAGWPTTPGTYHPTVSATGSHGRSGSVAFTWRPGLHRRGRPTRMVHRPVHDRRCGISWLAS